MIPDDIENDPVDAADERARVHAALARMPKRDALVLKLRHGIRDDGEGYPMTLEEITRILRITRERVRQIPRRARDRLLRRLAG